MSYINLDLVFATLSREFWGLLTANIIWISIVATGLGLLISQSAVAFELLRYLGAGYLAFIGYKICRYGLGKQQVMTGEKPKKYWQIYLQGILTSLSNPKALLFFLALFPNFTRQEFFLADILYFGALKLLILLVVMSAYGLVGVKYLILSIYLKWQMLSVVC